MRACAAESRKHDAHSDNPYFMLKIASTRAFSLCMWFDALMRRKFEINLVPLICQRARRAAETMRLGINYLILELELIA